MLEGIPPTKMRPWTPGWKGEIVEIKGAEWTVGKCSYDPRTNVVTISELPYQIKIETYIDGNSDDDKDDDDKPKRIKCLRDRTLIKGPIKNTSSKEQVCITFELVPGGIDEIMRDYGDENFDPLTDYLGLKDHFGAELNFTNDDGTVISFPTYEAAMFPWFKERYLLYPKRFARRIIIIDLKIKMLRNQIRYIAERSALKISGQKKARQIEILEEAKFAIFNVEKLKHPKVKNELIESVVHGEGASFNYLLNTTDVGSSSEGVELLNEKIVKLDAERAELRSPDITKRTWIAEIDAITARLTEVESEGWVKKGVYKYK
jgi:hypothetical protein